MSGIPGRMTRLGTELSVVGLGLNGNGRALRVSADAEIAASSRRMIGWLWLAGGVIVALGISRELYIARFGLETPLENLRQISLDGEQTVGAWFSSLLLLLNAGLLAVVALFARRASDRDWPRWTLLSLIFVALAIDESVSFHEALIDPLRAMLGVGGALHFAWVVPAIPLVFGLGLFFLPFLRRLPAPDAGRFALAGLIYVGGALGLEMVGGQIASQSGKASTSFVIAMCVEESMELIGLLIFAGALMNYLRQRWPQWRLRVI